MIHTQLQKPTKFLLSLIPSRLITTSSISHVDEAKKILNQQQRGKIVQQNSLRFIPQFIKIALIGIFTIIAIRADAQTSVKELLVHSKKYYYTDTDSAMLYAQKALVQAKQEGDSLQIGLSLQTVGIIHYLSHNYKQAVSLFHDIIYLFRTLDQPKDLAYTKNNLALVYQDLGLYEKAAELYLTNLRFWESINDTVGISKTCNNLGIIYERVKNDELALVYYNKALSYDSGKNKLITGSLYANKAGVLYRLNGDRSQAMPYYSKVLKLFKAIDAKDYISRTYQKISGFYINSLELDSALHYLNKAYDAQEKFAKNDYIYYTQLGEVYYKKKDYQQALSALNKAYQLAELNGGRQGVDVLLGWLRKVHAALGQYQKAFNYVLEEKILQDSFYSLEKTKIVQNLEIQYAVEKKEQQIISLNDSLELEQNKRALAEQKTVIQRIYRNIAIGGVGLGILLILLLINRMRLRNRLFVAREATLQHQNKVSELERKQLKLDLEHKNRRLSNLALAAVQKNEMLDTLEGKLQVLTEQGQQVSLAIKPIQRMIKEQTSIEEDWNEFKVHFEEVHPEFYKKLLSASSNLTQNDLRHCTYIKVKLDSKEIARIMGISPKSVQMSRYRIKKKLQLNKEDDLFVFIEQL